MTNSELFDSIDADSFYIEGAEIADTKAPKVPIERRWEERRFRPGWSIQPTVANSA